MRNDNNGKEQDNTPARFKDFLNRNVDPARQRGFSDGSSFLGNQLEYFIEFEYISAADPDPKEGIYARKYVDFKAFITSFEDSFSSNWNTQEVYGRPDPIYTFQNTKRSITISFDVPSASIYEAKQNMAKVSRMMRFLYPSYAKNDMGNASSITKPPLLRMRFTNLVKKDDTKGLLGKINGLSLSPNVEVGWFQAGPGELYPKQFNLNISFDVIHEHSLGWEDCSGKWEISCDDGGNETTDLIRSSYPYMKYGDSAQVLSKNPDPEGDKILNAQQIAPETARQMASSAFRAIGGTPVAAQGGTNEGKSNEEKKKEATNPVDKNAEPKSKGTPAQEEEAREKFILGTHVSEMD